MPRPPKMVRHIWSFAKRSPDQTESRHHQPGRGIRVAASRISHGIGRGIVSRSSVTPRVIIVAMVDAVDGERLMRLRKPCETHWELPMEAPQWLPPGPIGCRRHSAGFADTLAGGREPT